MKVQSWKQQSPISLVEIALEPDVPTYAVVSECSRGDTLHSAADLAVPMMAITLFP